MVPKSRPLFIAVALALVVASPGCTSDTQPTPAQKTEQAAQADLMPVRIRTGAGEHVFRVEVARSDPEQARGLMFRRSLPADGGMLFPFETVRPAAFWMRNTIIPLDMLFIRADGSIARIARETVPQSLETVASGEPVIAVLEIGGGRATGLGIAEGDKAMWPGGPQ